MAERTIEELVDANDPGWKLVQEWIGTAKNQVLVLPASEPGRSDALFQTQVTTHSILGAIVYETGGLLIDHGWLRILGSGHEYLNRTLPQFTLDAMGSSVVDSPIALIGDDAVGGFYGLYADDEGDRSLVSYLAPDTLMWEPLDLTYSEFIYQFCLNGDLESFYDTLRWPGWKEDIAVLSADESLFIYPPLWYKPEDPSELVPLEKKSKQTVTALEAFLLAEDIGSQLEPELEEAVVATSAQI